MSMEQVTYTDYSQCSVDFINGIEFFKRGMITQANHCFEMAYEKVSYNDLHHNKYASFCGYTRVLKGDRGGVSICREVAVNEIYDGDVFYNLAKVEWHYKNRKKTINTLKEGLSVDASHPGLCELRKNLGVRKKKTFVFLSRSHSLNVTVGKFFRK